MNPIELVDPLVDPHSFAFAVRSRTILHRSRQDEEHNLSDLALATLPVVDGYLFVQTRFAGQAYTQLLVPSDQAENWCRAVPDPDLQLPPLGHDAPRSWRYSAAAGQPDALPADDRWLMRHTDFSSGSSAGLLVPAGHVTSLLRGRLGAVVPLTWDRSAWRPLLHSGRDGIRVTLLAEPAAADVEATKRGHAPAGAAAKYPAVPRSGPRASDPRAVDSCAVDELPDRPEPGWRRVWTPDDMRNRLKAHNGLATADRDWRERDQRLLEQAISLGPDRPVQTGTPEILERLRQLNELFGEFEEATDHVLQHLQPLETVVPETDDARSDSETGDVVPATGRFTPLLLVGPPGIGKTHFARELARALQVPIESLDAAAGASASDLLGVQRRWSNSEPGRLWHLLAATPDVPANPVVLIDELDKVDRRADHAYDTLHHALLGLLERESAARVRDRCVDLPLNASSVNWIFTANTLRGIPLPLLSRLKIVAVPTPSTAQRLAKARAIAREVGARLGVAFDRRWLVELADLDARNLVRALEDLGRQARREGHRQVRWVDGRGRCRSVTHH